MADNSYNYDYSRSKIAYKYAPEMDGKLSLKIITRNIANAARDNSIEGYSLGDRLYSLITNIKQEKPDVFIALEANRSSEYMKDELKIMSHETLLEKIEKKDFDSFIAVELPASIEGIKQNNLTELKILSSDDVLRLFGLGHFHKFVAFESARNNPLLFTEVAARIERETGLKYIGCFSINATPMSFGKALFINPKKAAFGGQMMQHWIRCDDFISKWTGSGFGNDALCVPIFPVYNGKVVIDRHVTIMAVHFPMSLADRLQNSKWLASISSIMSKNTIVMGDFNTFSDDGGPDILRIIGEKWNHIDNDKVTFHAFPHDTITIPKGNLSLLSEETIIKEDLGDTYVVRPASILDHVFVHPDFPYTFDANVGHMTSASDHVSMSVTVHLDKSG